MRAQCAAALAALAFLAPPAIAWERTPVIEQMDVRITVGKGATLFVTETIEAEANSPQVFMLRTIPLRTPDGRLVRVRDVTARDGLGDTVKIDVREREDVVEVRPGTIGAEDPSQVRLQLSYTVYRALRTSGAVDSLDWIVAPNEWKGHVKKLNVEVHFPSSLRVTKVVHATLTKSDATPIRARTIQAHRRVILEAPLPVKAEESARLTVVWPSGHVNFATPEPPAPWPWWMRLPLSGAWIVPGSLLVLTALLWTTSRSRAGRATVARYAPPAGLRPGEAGVVIDGRIDAEDVVASVVDLATRGYVTLERAPGSFDVMVTVTRPWVSAPDVRPWEAVLLANVFTSPGLSSIPLSALRAPRDTASIREALSADLAERGFFATAPLALRRAGRWVAFIVAAIWVQLAWLDRADAATISAGVATGVVLWLLAGVIAAGGLTEQGRRAREALRGFREFLARVDTPRLERLPAGALDDHLPWAVALGVTEAWLSPTPVR
jgi:hypothetical protein